MIFSMLEKAAMMFLSNYRLGQVKNGIQGSKESLQTYPEGCP